MSDQTQPTEAPKVTVFSAQAMKDFFVNAASRDLEITKANHEVQVKTMEEDLAKAIAMSPGEFMRTFFSEITPNMDILQGMMGRFKPPVDAIKEAAAMEKAIQKAAEEGRKTSQPAKVEDKVHEAGEAGIKTEKIE